ncbi:S8 family serine peptidase [Teredinibacter purpureus]|uniref:S8 family serine peptidase n=1 Tax=Teredinibacter purpureus TaxID=2731756 RepID=UPI000696B28E|nr:S8 family serine peptidase [Teredinibacter purpureus]
MNRSLFTVAQIVFLSVVISACGGGGGGGVGGGTGTVPTASPTSPPTPTPIPVPPQLYSVSTSSLSEDCLLGYSLNLGPDSNWDARLNASEIESSTRLCAALNAVIYAVTPVGAEDNHCSEGGERVSVGEDTNGDGIVAPEEELYTGTFCAAEPLVVEVGETYSGTFSHSGIAEPLFIVDIEPLWGELFIDDMGGYTYSQNEAFSGQDQFSVTVSGVGSSVSFAVVVGVDTSNFSPIMVEQAVTIHRNILTTGQLTAVDFNNDLLTYEIVGEASNDGLLHVLPTGEYSYLPTYGFLGQSSFVVRAYDGEAYSEEAALIFNVLNREPTAQDQSYGVYSSERLIRQLPGVDADNDTLTYELLSNDAFEGALSLSAEGLLHYMPAETFSGSETIQYRVFDGDSFSSPATLTFTVLEATGNLISDLTVTNVGLNDASLSWSSSDALATRYILRINTQNITLDNWETSTDIPIDVVAVESELPVLFTLNSLSENVTYFVAVRTATDTEILGTLSNVASFSTLSRASLEIIPQSLPHFELEQNTSLTTSVIFRNAGDFPLDFSVDFLEEFPTFNDSSTVSKHTYLPLEKGAVDPRKGDIAINSAGGPDRFGYAWADSNENGGPVFEWIEISETGTVIEGLYDDSLVKDIPIGFDFPFYGESFSTFHLSSNGYLTFADTDENGCCSPQPIPSKDLINSLIAWLWKDLHPNDGTVYYQSFDENYVVVQFENYGEYGSTDAAVNAQVILYASGAIKLQYLNFDGGLETRLSSIGMENYDGSDGLQVAFSENYLEPNLAILIKGHDVEWMLTDVEAGTIAPGEVKLINFTYAGNNPVDDYAADIHVNLNQSALVLDTVIMPVSLSITDDITAPIAITSLASSDRDFDRVTLQWASVANSKTYGGALTAYDIRYSTTPITEDNWSDALPATGLPLPSEPNTQETVMVEGLSPSTQYYFALRGIDQNGNASLLSNSVEVTTLIEPVLALEQSSLEFNLAEGTEDVATITLSNVGEAMLNYQFSLEEVTVTAKPSKRKLSRGVAAEPPSPILYTQLPSKGTYEPFDIVVRLKPSLRLADIQQLHAHYSATVTNTIAPLNMEVWRLDTQTDLLNTLQSLNSNDAVYFAELNYKLASFDIPDDPRLGELWGLHNEGQTGGSVDADIDAVEAWNIWQGSHNTVVAVIDTGIDYSHPELVGNIWVNDNEIPDNNVDDDLNGYVDDVHGYDFANGDGDPLDDNDHGTHVAGTIGATGNDGIGIVGVNHAVKLMAVKFLSGSGGGSTAQAIESIVYAVDNGATILNNSWGGGAESVALLNAIQYANDQDVLFVAAAGNRGTNNDALPSFPSGYEVDNIIAVAATDHNDLLASFSQYGLATVDLGAPGVDILSSVTGGGTSSFSGTSMATPHVAGVAALVKSYKTSLTTPELKAILLESVNPIDSLLGKTVTGGRLNAYDALQLSGPDWIVLPDIRNGSLTGGESATVELSINALALPVGDYVIDLVFASNDPENPRVTVPVTVTVTDDGVAPSAIVDLTVSDIADTQAVFNFTATGDDGSQGTATRYDIRYSDERLTEQNWNEASAALVSAQPLGAGETETITVTGLQGNSSLWVGVKVIDFGDLASALSNVVSIDTLNTSLVVTPRPIPVIAIEEGELAVVELSLTNDGDIDLEVSVAVDYNASGASQLQSAQYVHSEIIEKGEEDRRRGSPVTLSSGGPDTFGYRWSDSHDSSGPLYDWIDIALTGTEITGFGDDNVRGPITIGFNFPFYGGIQNEVFVSSNGFISFDQAILNGCCSGQPIPREDSYNNLIAWLWDDLHPKAGLVHYQVFDDERFVLQFSGYGEFGGAGSIDAQVILSANGAIKLQYRNISSGMDISRASIGIENENGTDGLQVSIFAPYVENELALEFTNFWLSVGQTTFTLPTGETAALQLNIDGRSMTADSYETNVTLFSNDLDEPIITLPVTVEVTAPIE